MELNKVISKMKNLVCLKKDWEGKDSKEFFDYQVKKTKGLGISCTSKFAQNVKPYDRSYKNANIVINSSQIGSQLRI